MTVKGDLVSFIGGRTWYKFVCACVCVRVCVMCVCVQVVDVKEVKTRSSLDAGIRT